MSPDTERDVLGYGERAVSDPAASALDDRVTEYGVLVAQAAKQPKPPPVEKGRSAKVLLISERGDASLKATSESYAEQVLRVSPRDMKAARLLVGSWQELAGTLLRYDSIGELVLMFHGVPGSLMVGDTIKGLADVSSLFEAKRPKVGKIVLEGCSIGEGPDQLVPFGRLFDASTITAFNYFWVSKLATIPAGTDAIAIDKMLEPYRKYLLPGTPDSATLGSLKRDYSVVVEWFRSDYNKEDLPPAPATGTFDLGSETLKQRSSAKLRRIEAAQADRLAEEYRVPVFPFEQVVVNLR